MAESREEQCTFVAASAQGRDEASDVVQPLGGA
jgi:hypothetical protein